MLHKIIFCCLFICYTYCSYGQSTFKVCDKTPQELSEKATSFSSTINEVFRSHKLFACASDTIPIFNMSGTNPFMSCLALAYDKHYDISISPDMIWLLLCQGFATHIRQNSAKFKDKLVKSNAEKTLTRYRFDDNIDSTAWQSLIDNLTKKIKENTHKDLNNLLVKKFSTTSNKENYTYQITLMDAVSPYFEYEDYGLCGIPQITLEGKPEDWVKLKQHAQELKKYELGWWINSLNPIFDEFIAASKGKVNKTFWNNIYQFNPEIEMCLGFTSNGWIFKFFPYTKTCYGCEEGLTLIKSPIFSKKNRKIITIEELPNGISAVPFKWHLTTGEEFDMKLVAGFIGFNLSKKYTLRPYIHWVVLKEYPSEDTE